MEEKQIGQSSNFSFFIFFLGGGVKLLLRGEGGSSKTTVAQKCSGAMEIQKYDQQTDQQTYGPTDRLTWVVAGDTCVFK